MKNYKQHYGPWVLIPGAMNKILGVLSKQLMSRDMNTRMSGMLMGKASRKLSNEQLKQIIT